MATVASKAAEKEKLMELKRKAQAASEEYEEAARGFLHKHQRRQEAADAAAK